MSEPLLARFSLRVLLPLVIGLFAALVGLTSYLNTQALLDDKIREQALFDTRQQLTLAQGALETFLRNGDREAAARMVASFGSDGSTRLAMLTDRQGVIIGSTRFSDLGHAPEERGNPLPPTMRSQVARTAGIDTRIFEDSGAVIGMVSVCDSASVSGALRPTRCGILYLEKRLSYFAAPVKAALEQQSLQETFGLLAGGFLLWLLLHAIVTRRARDIVATVERFGHEQRDARTRLKGGDEIARVGQAVDRMLDRIVDNERHLADSEALLATIIDGVAEGIITFDDSGRVMSFNAGATRIFGHPAREILGRDIGALLFASFERDQLLPENETAGDIYTRELRARCRNETPIDTEWRLRQTTFGQHHIITAVVRDISEARKLASMQKEFTSVVSHELRTPLTSLHGSLRMLTSGVLASDSDQAQALLTVAERNSRRLLNLVNDILDVQKLGMESLKLNLSEFDLGELARNCAENNRGYFEKYQVGFEIDIRTDNPQVRADVFRIEQVIANLLSNAAKYSPSGDAVRLTIDDEDDALRVSVADRGRGIPESFRSRIFEPFFQVDSSDARAKEGTGLGLSICRSIIQKHGGRLDFESEAGLGTRFYFILPRQAQDTLGDAPQASASPSP